MVARSNRELGQAGAAFVLAAAAVLSLTLLLVGALARSGPAAWLLVAEERVAARERLLGAEPLLEPRWNEVRRRLAARSAGGR